MTTQFPAPHLRHLAALTDETGIVEHARLSLPRPELGYCTDDAGRALATACSLATDPDAHRIAEASMTFLERAPDGARTLPRPTTDPAWPWPAPTLTYANAVLPDALLAAGAHLGEQPLVEQGLQLLSWLAAEEKHQDHFSFAPVGGRGPGGYKPAFDQQPIEAAAMPAACARAFSLTEDAHWHVLVVRAAAWFFGRNDASALLYDPATGGCRDGLQRTGPNLNEGAESTIAFLDAMASARRLAQLTKEAS